MIIDPYLTSPSRSTDASGLQEDSEGRPTVRDARKVLGVQEQPVYQDPYLSLGGSATGPTLAAGTGAESHTVDALRERTLELEHEIDILRSSGIRTAAHAVSRPEAQFLLTMLAEERRLDLGDLASKLRPRGWALVIELVRAGLADVDGAELTVTKQGQEWAATIRDGRQEGVL